MLPKLGVSSSGYYSWKNWRKSEPEDGKQIYEGYEFKSNMGKEI